MRITWRGHAFFQVECNDGTKLLIDPYVANGKTSKDLAFFKAWKPDMVLVTHGHNDHFGQAVDIGAPILGIFEVATYAKTKGASAEGMNIGGTFAKKGVRITMTFAAHSSGLPAPEGQPLLMGGASAGYVIDDGQTKLYHAGDTGLFGDMRSVIGEVLRPDVACLPIGGHYTMDPAQAALATKWLGVKHVIPMHYDTFPPIRQDPQEFVKGVGSAAKVHVLKVDEGVEV